MHIISEAFWIQKHGSLESEYEDSFWPRHPLDRTCEKVAFAIADGATESSFSSIWARQLARSYVRHGWESDETLAILLRKSQRLWTTIVTRRPLPWYAEQKLQQGAFAALLGLTLRENDGGNRTWSILASGDCCLVQIRNDSVHYSCPLSSSEDFTNTPTLLATDPMRNRAALAEIVRLEGDWQPGDNFYLMTDALAAWFFRELERDEQPWHMLRDIGPEGIDFHTFVRAEQQSGRMRNDDVTLYKVEPL